MNYIQPHGGNKHLEYNYISYFAVLAVRHGLCLCMLGNFSCFCCPLLAFFLKFTFSKNFFQEHYQSVKWFGSRSGPTFCQSQSGSGPDLDRNCLKR